VLSQILNKNLFSFMAFQVYFKHFIAIVTIIIVAIAVERTVRFMIGKFLQRRAEQMNIDKTKYVFLKHVVTAVIYSMAIIAIIYTLPKFRSIAVSLFAGAGIFAAILGFASQAAFSNIISGVFMVISKPFKVGDRIEVGNRYTGIVEDITLRHTVLRNFDNQRIVIPNSVMSSETIINAHLYDDVVRRNIDFIVDYQSNIDVVMKIMQEECESHPLCIDYRTKEDLEKTLPKVQVRLIQFGDSAITFRAYAWSANAFDAFDMHTDLNIIIKKRFDKEGIQIPFPQRVISYRVNES
jgi:small conductance mechanosensitive channel